MNSTIKVKNILKGSLRSSLFKKTNEKIVFFHMPKCGGTSVHFALQSAYGLAQNIYQRNLIKLDHYGSKEAAELMSIDMMEFREKLLFYFLSQKHPKFISGHFAFSNDADQVFGDTWKYVTFLREPVRRWFSHFYFNNSIESGSKNLNNKEINTKLKNFLLEYPDRAKRMAEVYVSNLSGNFNLSGEQKLDLALKNTSKFSVIGRLEDIKGFENSFENSFGVKIKINHLNSNKKKPTEYAEVIDSELLNEITNLCKYDSKIYKQIFSKDD